MSRDRWGIFDCRGFRRKKIGEEFDCLPLWVRLPVMAAIAMRKKVVSVGHSLQNFCFQSLYFLFWTEYHYDVDYNSRRVGVVVVVVFVVIVNTFKKWITVLCLCQFGSYLVGGCTRVRRFTFTSYPIFVIRLPQTAQPAYQPKSEKRA